MIMIPPLNRILYVEDDHDLQIIVRLTLENLGGFKVQVVGSGEDALLTAPRFKPDLIMLDVMMPKMDGPAILRALRAGPDTANIPVMFITARSQVAEIRELLNQGAIHVIGKPFDPFELCTTLRSRWDTFYTAQSSLPQ
jgi:two-component system, OmpR family, response regulator